MTIPSNLTMDLSNSLWLALHSLTIVFYAGFAAFVYLRRPPSALWPVLFWLQVSAVLWAGGDLLAILSPDVGSKSAALMVLYTGSIPSAALWWMTAVRFAEANRIPFSWGRRPWVYAPLGFAAVMWLCFVTNPWHGQFIEPVVGARQVHHWMWWTTCVANLGLSLWTAVLYFSLARRPAIPARLREQADLLLAAAIAMPTANVVDSLLPQIWPVDLSIAIGSVVGALYLYGIYQSNLFDLAPLTLEQIVRADPTGVLITDRSLRLRFANEAAHRLLPGVPLDSGVPVPEALASHLVPYRDPQTPERRAAASWDARVGTGQGRLYRFESEAPGTEGRTGWLWIGATTLPACAQSRGLRCLRVQDVTELVELSNQRRELTDRLERSERLESLGVLAGGVAQELVEPLAAVRSGAERARNLAGGDSELGRLLRRVADEARRGSEIAAQMLRFATEGAVGRKVDDLNRHVASACAQAADSVRRRGAAVSLDLSRQPLLVRCEAAEIEQLVVHLLQNAAEACGRGGQIQVRTELSERDAWIVVSDDGPGMDEPVRLRAFEPFYTTRRSEGASGLGLSVVYGIASAHGGDVEIRSKPGRGCVVDVRLPLAMQNPPHARSGGAQPSDTER